MAESTSSSQGYSNITDRRQSEFRKLISNISERLLPEEVARCSFIHDLPKDRASSALDTLEYLMRKGAFSHSNVEPLVKLLKDVNRHDLVTEHVDVFNNELLSKSLPLGTRTQPVNPVVERSNTVPVDITLSSGFLQSPAVQESSPTSAAAPGETPTHNSNNNTPAPSMRRESSAADCYTPQEMALPTHTAEEEISQDQTEAMTTMTTPNKPRSFIPVKWNDSLSLIPQEMVPKSSASSSMNELDQYHNSQSNHSQEVHQAMTTPTGPHNFTQTIPRTRHNNIKPTGGLFMKSTSPVHQGTLSTGSSPLTVNQQSQNMGIRSMSESRAHRSVTPLEIVNKRISEPNFPLQTHSGPWVAGSGLRGAPLRPASRNSGWSEVSGASHTHFLTEHTQQDVDVFPSSQQSSQGDGTESSPQLPGLADGGSSDKGKLFRKRPGSRKRLLKKLTGGRSNPSSSVSWSVRRKKINEAIYEHQKDKLIKCPKKLELENGGKHPPKLTLYLHPYGYEGDAQQNLTLAIILDVSVRCNLPSSAVVYMTVTAKETTGGRQLNTAIVDCPVNARITRYQSFLSHKELRELECEGIDFTVSARLVSDGLTD